MSDEIKILNGRKYEKRNGQWFDIGPANNSVSSSGVKIVDGRKYENRDGQWFDIGAEDVKKKDTISNGLPKNGGDAGISEAPLEDGLTKTGNTVDGIATVTVDEEPKKSNWRKIIDYQSPINPEFKSTLENPTAEGINSIVNAVVKKRIDERNAKRAALSLQGAELKPQEFEEEGTRASAFPATPQEKSIVQYGMDNTVTTNDYTEKQDTKFSKNLKDRFYSGNLAPEDVDIVVNNSDNIPLKDKISSSEVAAYINNKTKKLNEVALELAKDPFEYAITKKRAQDTMDDLVKDLYNASSEQDAEAIKGKLNEIRGQMDFAAREMKPKMQTAKDKAFAGLVDMLESRVATFGEKYNYDKAKELMNEYLMNLDDPYLMAEQGFEGEIQFAPKDAKSFKTDNGTTYRSDDGKMYFFNKSSSEEIKKRVNSYFTLLKPAKERAIVKYSPKDENVLNSKEIGKKYFSGDNLKNFDAVLGIQEDSIRSVVKKKYWDEASGQPEFARLKKIFQDKVVLGENEETALADFQKAVENSEALKPFFVKMEKELKDSLKTLIQKRETFINEGLKAMGSVSLEELKAAEESGLFERFDKDVNDEIAYQLERQKAAANEAEMNTINFEGVISYSFRNAVNKSLDGINESFARYFNMTDVVNAYSDKRIEDEKWEGDYLKEHSSFKGWTSLLDPSYYAYNIGQSLPYMAPALIAGVATGGAGGVALASGIGALSETGADALMTADEVYRTGVDKYGEKISRYEAGEAAKENFANELFPNLILSYVEFGALLRGITGGAVKTGVKKTIGREILGATSDLLQTGVAEASQEGLQGYIQQSAKDKAQGKPVMGIFDYMQTDDFRQNFFGGLSGGLGFGVFGFGKRIANAPAEHTNWKNLIKASGNLEEFDKSALRSYALNEETNGRGAQFRDALRNQIYLGQTANEEEVKILHNTLLYSEALKAYSGKFNLKNISGLATAHNLIMADSYDKAAKEEGNNAMGKVLAEKSKGFLEEAKRIMDGNTDGVYYVNHSTTGAPVFMSKRDAEVLGTNGAIQKMYDGDLISGTSANIAIKKAEFSTEEQAAVKGLSGKDFSKSIIKPYTDVIQSETATVKEKKQALKGLSDQLTAKTTEAEVGTALGKSADLIYDLKHPVVEESKDISKIGKEAARVMEEPTQEQIQDDVDNKRFLTVEYKSEKEIPAMWKDKVSSVATTNGETVFRVTLPTSQFKYEAQEQKSKNVSEYRKSEDNILEQEKIELENAEKEIENTRVAAIKSVAKPGIKLDLGIPKTVLVKSKDRVKNIAEHESIKNDFESLQDIISCIYG